MPTNPPPNMPRITSYLLYEDVERALEWLTRAFGLRERMRIPGPTGRSPMQRWSSPMASS